MHICESFSQFVWTLIFCSILLVSVAFIISSRIYKNIYPKMKLCSNEVVLIPFRLVIRKNDQNNHGNLIRIDIIQKLETLTKLKLRYQLDWASNNVKPLVWYIFRSQLVWSLLRQGVILIVTLDLLDTCLCCMNNFC